MTPAIVDSKAPFPDALEFLFPPARYKVAYGGRGASKSWGFARALLIKGTQEKLRILCARETMKSLRDSVHELLETQIRSMGLDAFYRVEKSVIYGSNGTEVLFTGIKHHIDNIKSMEGINICWVEEAQTVSKTSWDKLIPTLFRVPNCELWISFNPDLESDNTYQRFVVTPPADAVVRKLTWRDNPWFPPGLRLELEQARKLNADEYNHIWEGACINTLANAIYANELRLVDTEGRIRRVPYDPTKPVDTAWDLGYGDMVCIWMFQSFPMEYRLIDYEEGSQHPLHYYIAELQKRGYVWGTDYLPWDGGLKAMGSGKSIEDLMRAAGRKIKVASRLPITDGINMARTIFPLCWFDEQRCAEGLRHLRCYRYGEMQSYEGPSREPLHDLHCLVPDTLVLTKHGTRRIMDLQGEEVLTPCGWSTYQGPWITQRNAQLVEVRFTDGNTVRCTPDHLFLTTESGWKSAESLTPNTSIRSCSISSCNISTVAYGKDGQAQFITRRHTVASIERFGRVLLDRFQKVAISIIATITLPITVLRIWNACLNLNIPGNGSIAMPPFPNRQEKGLQNGIVPKLAGYGIDSRPENAKRGENVNANSRSANSAALNSWHSSALSIHRDSVQRSADRRGVTDTPSQPDAIRTSNRKTGPANPEHASSAAANSWELFAAATRRCFAQRHAEPLSITTRKPPAAPSIVGNGNPRSATSAAPNLWQWFARRTSTDSVRISAGSLVIASLKHLANRRTVNTVAANLWRLCGLKARRNSVPRYAEEPLTIESVLSLNERADVCCIEVPDIHCFSLANGAVVHNSHAADSFRTMAVSIRQPQKEQRQEEQRQRQYASPWS